MQSRQRHRLSQRHVPVAKSKVLADGVPLKYENLEHPAEGLEKVFSHAEHDILAPRVEGDCRGAVSGNGKELLESSGVSGAVPVKGEDLVGQGHRLCARPLRREACPLGRAGEEARDALGVAVLAPGLCGCEG
jgi:hypothetical protein